MDFKEDLIIFKNLGYNALKEKLQDEVLVITKKQYLFDVLNILKQLEQKITSGFFKENKYLYLFQKYDYDRGQIFTDIALLDKKQEKQNKYNESGNYIEELDFVIKLLGNGNFILEETLCNPDLIKKELVVELNHEACEILKNYLLNDELKKVADYIHLSEKIFPKKKITKHSKV